MLQHPQLDVSTEGKDTEKNVPNDGQTQQNEYPRGLARTLILGPVTLAYFLWFLDLAVVSTATPAITTQFNSLTDVGWYESNSALPPFHFVDIISKVRRSVSTRQFSISAFGRQDLPLFFHEGKHVFHRSSVSRIYRH